MTWYTKMLILMDWNIVNHKMERTKMISNLVVMKSLNKCNINGNMILKLKDDMENLLKEVDRYY